MRPGFAEYILQTHNTKIFEDSLGAWTPNPSLGTPVRYYKDF